MCVKKISSALLREEYYEIDHKSGLKIFVYPKEDYKSSYAIFGTRYGSINNAFSLDGGEVVKVPDGIAHYLEHKLFESEDLDAFERYAATGANANAYTGFDKTCYLFSCGSRFKENLEILLDFVRSPYFTEETVKKEQGIIAQEIKMYDDSPSWVVLFNMLDKMYWHHPVKIDIAGTVESISEITPGYLYQCYETFYNLNNMVLCCVGNVSVEEVMEIADRMLEKSEKHEIKRFFEKEEEGVVEHYVEQKMAVGIPIFNYGFKIDAQTDYDEKKTVALDILVGALSSSESKLYRELFDKGLINNTFDYEYFAGDGFRAILFSGESRNPKEVAKIINRHINEAKKNGISRESFDCTKKSIYGEYVSGFNSVDLIANRMTDLYFYNKEIFRYVDAIAEVEYEEVCDLLEEVFNEDKTVLSVVC